MYNKCMNCCKLSHDVVLTNWHFTVDGVSAYFGKVCTDNPDFQHIRRLYFREQWDGQLGNSRNSSWRPTASLKIDELLDRKLIIIQFRSTFYVERWKGTLQWTLNYTEVIIRIKSNSEISRFQINRIKKEFNKVIDLQIQHRTIGSKIRLCTRPIWKWIISLNLWWRQK